MWFQLSYTLVYTSIMIWALILENPLPKVIGVFRKIHIFEKITFSKSRFLFFEIFRKNNFSFFQKYFLSSKKKKLRNFLDHHIDVKFCGESIFRIPGAIWWLLWALESKYVFPLQKDLSFTMEIDCVCSASRSYSIV